MELKSAIWGRRTIRRFLNKKIPKNLLNEILQAGIQAPSSCNQQMFYFISIDNGNLKRRLLEEAGFKWIDRIPNPFFVITDKRFGNERFANIQGAAAAIQNMMLYAYSIKIGSCWMAGYGDKAIVKKLLNIPSYFHILGCVGFGYADEKPIFPIKRNLSEILFSNKVNFALKKSNNPDDWSYNEIKNLAARTIFAKSPNIGYYHLFALELEKQLDFVNRNLGESVLYLDDISGIYIFELAARKPDSKFYMVSPSEKLIEWMREKADFHRLKNIHFIYSRNLEVNKKDFDTVLCLDQFNRIPADNRNELVNLSYRNLRKDGKLIISFLNKYSIYGMLFRSGVARRYGPEISLPWSHVCEIITKNKFNILERVGFNLLPSPRLFFKIGVPGRYTFFNRYMRFLAKFNFFEGSVSKGFLSRFSTTNIIVVKK